MRPGPGAPRGDDRALRDELGLELVPGTGPLAAVVPGAFGGWLPMLRDYGTLPLREVLRFAIGYAEDGYPMLPQIAGAIRNVEALFRDEWTTSAEVYLPVPGAGALHRNPRLAATYRRILDEVEAGERSTRRSTAGIAASSRRPSCASRRRSGSTARVRATPACSSPRICATGAPSYEPPLAVDYTG